VFRYTLLLGVAVQYRVSLWLAKHFVPHTIKWELPNLIVMSFYRKLTYLRKRSFIKILGNAAVINTYTLQIYS